MRYDVRHRTTFTYEDTVSIAQHMVHLKPRATAAQQRLSFLLTTEPEASQLTERTDYYGNEVHYITLQQPHETFVVESKSLVEITTGSGLDLSASPPWEALAADTNALLAAGALEFAFPSQFIVPGEEPRQYAAESFTAGRPVLDASMDLTARIYRDFEYRGGVSDVSTPIEQVLATRQGVCQDFAHLQIACLRSLGLPARYVSGYLLTHPPEGQERLVGADASHAWIAVWSGTEWVDFDPTNNQIPSGEHITVGWGRDYGDVSPTTGFILGGGGHEVLVAVDVTPAVA